MSVPGEKREICKTVENDDVNPATKKIRLDHYDIEDAKLASFLQWCTEGGLKLNSKVCVSKRGSCAQYGMIAIEDIREGEVIFEIPRALTFNSHTYKSTVNSHLLEERNNLNSSSGWVQLLIALMQEYTNPAAHWKPYVNLVPDFELLDLPMFWSREEREKELAGTGLIELVERDLNSLTSEFNNVALPFIKKHSDVISVECQNLELYKKMVAFVMAYSFTETPQPCGIALDDSDSSDDDESPTHPPMMVPMADILNHVSANNANMIFGKESLTMVAKCPIKKGEEVYNTYGCNSNSALLHMYGFAEQFPNNIYDTVEIPMQTVIEVCRSSELMAELPFLQQRLQYLENLDLMADHRFVVGVDGFLTDDEMLQTLKILTVSEEEFNQYKLDEYWEDVDENSESLDFENLSHVSPMWKKILLWTSESLLKCYPHTLKEEEEMQQQLKSAASTPSAAATAYGINSADNTSMARKLITRRLYCSYVRHGQMKLLEKLSAVCKND